MIFHSFLYVYQRVAIKQLFFQSWFVCFFLQEPLRYLMVTKTRVSGMLTL